jgi:hypothetical protein
MILAVIGATVLSWKHLLPAAVLTPPELNLKHQTLKPPPEPVTFEEDYAQARRRPCGRSEPLISTTICDVLSVPELFADKCIRVPGRFLSDGLEHSVIIDDSCSKMGLIPWATEKETKKLDEAIWQPGKGHGTLDRRITGRFTGRFVWRPNAKQNARVLEINVVSHLKIEELPQR